MVRVGQPDVLISSWLLPDKGCNPALRRMVSAWRAVEIFPVFAAGNWGPEPASDGSPANYTGLAPGGGAILAVGGPGPGWRGLPAFQPGAQQLRWVDLPHGRGPGRGGRGGLSDHCERVLALQGNLDRGGAGRGRCGSASRAPAPGHPVPASRRVGSPEPSIWASPGPTISTGMAASRCRGPWPP